LGNKSIQQSRRKKKKSDGDQDHIMKRPVSLDMQRMMAAGCTTSTAGTSNRYVITRDGGYNLVGPMGIEEKKRGA